MGSTRKESADIAKPKVALALPDGDLRQRLLELLDRVDVEVQSVPRDDSLWEEIKGHDADVVVIRRSQIPPGGSQIIDALTDSDDNPDIVIVSDRETPSDRARLLAAGATHVVSEDSPNDELGDTLESLAVAAAEGGLDGPEAGGSPAEPRLADFISRSPRMKDFIDVVGQVVATDTSLLITGETGVGKERLARAIHAESRRSAGPFVTVNCGALPESLLESELFGHRRGAFTGAQDDRRGQFELATRGTIFLDEIGDMPRPLQVKLLTVLQRHEIQRLGSEEIHRVDVRVMAATNRDLREEVAQGRFREDLYYRLNVMPLDIPPLRERREDIPDLVGSFLKHFREALDKSHVEGISEEALQALLHYGFPGNVRELVNVVERAMLLCRESTITLSELPREIVDRSADVQDSKAARETGILEGLSRTGDQGSVARLLDQPLREARQTFLAAFEEKYLRGLLERTSGVVGETARLAGITSRSLYDKMRRYGLRKEDFRR